MKLLKQNATRCWVLRSEPEQMLPGFVTTWRARTMTVLVAPRAGLQLNEAVVVKIDRPSDLAGIYPATLARLYSRVVSIIWQDAGDLVGLAVWKAKTSSPPRFQDQLSNRTPSGPVS